MLDSLEPFAEVVSPPVTDGSPSLSLSPVDELEMAVCRWWNDEENTTSRDEDDFTWMSASSGDLLVAVGEGGFEECKTTSRLPMSAVR